jgi:F-type H+-transporting ATPase subunit b
VEINITMIVQMLVFAAFVLFTMKFVWPPIEKAIEDRQDSIAEGLSAAERGKKEFELAQLRSTEQLKTAKVEAQAILDKAKSQGLAMIDKAKEEAEKEAQRVYALAKTQLEQEVESARSRLKTDLANLAIKGAEKIIQSELDANKSQVLLDKLIEEM